jgi:hypothetical protein
MTEQKCTCKKVPELNYVSSNPDCPVCYPKIDWEKECKMKSDILAKEYGKVTTFANRTNEDLTDRLDMIFKVLLKILRELEQADSK